MAIVDYYSESSYLADQVLADIPPCWMLISQIPALTAHISFLLSELIFGTPGVGRSSPPSNGDYRFLLWELIFGWLSVGRYTPLLNADFTDSCFDSSYFIPTLRTHIWQTRCWQIYPPYQMAIVDSYSENSYLSDQMLADLRHIKWLFHRLLLWQLIFHSYCESSYLSDQVLADLHPKWQFHTLLFWQLIFHSYSESSYLADQMLADLPSLSNGNFTDCCSDSSYLSFLLLAESYIPFGNTRCWQIYPPPHQMAYCRFLLWELIFGRPRVGRSTPLKPPFHKFLLWQLILDSYSESSYLARPNVGRYNPPVEQLISQIPALTAHISFLLWELIFDTPGVGRSIPPSNGNYTFLLWELIFGRPSVGRSIPPSNGNDTFLLWELIFDRPDVGRSTLPWMAISQIAALIAHIHSYSENSYLADQVLADIPPCWMLI